MINIEEEDWKLCIEIEKRLKYAAQLLDEAHMLQLKRKCLFGPRYELQFGIDKRVALLWETIDFYPTAIQAWKAFKDNEAKNKRLVYIGNKGKRRILQ